MSSNGAIQIEGIKDLRRRLRRAGDDLSDMKDLHAEIAASVVARARSKAPVRDGNLARTLRGSGTKTNAAVRLGTRRAPYANAIHWGRKRWPNTAATSTPSGRAPHASIIRARPFIMETARAMDGEIQAKYAAFIDKTINTK